MGSERIDPLFFGAEDRRLIWRSVCQGRVV